MKHLKRFNESKSNYSLENWPNGEYSGIIKGYEVYSDEIDSGFKTTTGLRNMVPIPCRIWIKDGGATVFFKGGVLFSDDDTRDKWVSEFGKLENDLRYKN